MLCDKQQPVLRNTVAVNALDAVRRVAEDSTLLGCTKESHSDIHHHQTDAFDMDDLAKCVSCNVVPKHIKDSFPILNTSLGALRNGSQKVIFNSEPTCRPHHHLRPRRENGAVFAYRA